jgi:endonuclease III
MTVKKAVTAKIIRLLEEKYQDASLALDFSNPLQLLVSTILAAQCTGKRINDLTK